MNLLEIIFLPSITTSVGEQSDPAEFLYQDMMDEKRRLYEVIGSNITTDGLLSQETSKPELFSIKFVMSDHKTLSRILISVCAPINVSRSLKNKAIYSHINWQKIFINNIKKGDHLVVPITMLSVNKNAAFYDYTLDQLSEILVFRLTK